LKIKRQHNLCSFVQAFTFWELLAVIAIMSVLASLIFTYVTRPKRTGHPILCTSNLRQIQVASLMFASDHDQNFPFTVTNSPAYQNTTDAWLHFYSLSNELRDPRVLVCPQDIERRSTMASAFSLGTNSTHATLSVLRNSAVSYFVNLDAKETDPDAVFIGDRNVYVPERRATNALLTVSGTNHLQWTGSQHTNRGNIQRSDGRVESGVNNIPAWPDHPDKIRLLLPY